VAQRSSKHRDPSYHTRISFLPKNKNKNRREKTSARSPELSSTAKILPSCGLAQLETFGELHPLGGRTGPKKPQFGPRLLLRETKKQHFLLHEQTKDRIRWSTNWSGLEAGVNRSGSYCASANLLFNKTKRLCSITKTNNSPIFFLQKQHGLFRLLNFFFQFSWAMFTVLSKFSKSECKPSVSIDNNEIIILSWKRDTLQQMKYFSTAYKGWITDCKLGFDFILKFQTRK